MFIIFGLITVSFNILVEDYITRDIEAQLNNTLNTVVDVDLTIRIGGVYITITEVPQNARNKIPGIYEAFYRTVIEFLKKSKFNEVSTIIYNEEYTRLYPEDDLYYMQDLEEMDVLISFLKTKGDVEDYRILKTSTTKGNYYYTSVNLDDLYGLEGLNLLLFVNRNKYAYLTKNISNMLVGIISFATIIMIVFVLFLSRSISRPIQKLSDFAEKIGRGDFSECDLQLSDIELINLNNSMNETAHRLNTYDNEQKTFFQNVSHELRTPLMSIKGYAEGIKYGVFREESDLVNSSDIIISETDRLSELVEDLLYISRIDSVKEMEKTGTVDLFELVANCIEKLRGILISSKKHVNFNYPDTCTGRSDETFYIICDERSLIRAIMNILSNAIRYAKTTIDITLRESETQKNKAILTIQDDGEGINENDLPNIFKRFYKGKSGNHGIGLAITKAVLDYHKAEIFVENNETGALFTIIFDIIDKKKPTNNNK